MMDTGLQLCEAFNMAGPEGALFCHEQSGAPDGRACRWISSSQSNLRSRTRIAIAPSAMPSFVARATESRCDGELGSFLALVGFSMRASTD
jgi:hypothetical protein